MPALCWFTTLATLHLKMRFLSNRITLFREEACAGLVFQSSTQLLSQDFQPLQPVPREILISPTYVFLIENQSHPVGKIGHMYSRSRGFHFDAVAIKSG